LVASFVLGLAGGYQSIYTKFGSDAPRVLTTVTGWIYWLSRGFVPVIVYAIWHQSQQPLHDSFLAAALCGLGSEAVLRSRFYLGERKVSDGKVEEVAKGVFDLLNWYQVLCLKTSGDKLADERQKFIETLMANETDFIQLCRRARSNAGAWAIEEEKQKLLNLISDLEGKFRAAANGKSGDELKELHEDFILELGYAAMRLVGRDSLKTLFK
jgi:hypothetical protein